MAGEDKTISGFTPELARQIARFVRDQVRVTGSPANPIGGREPSQKHCFAKITDQEVAGSIVTHAWTEVRWSLGGAAWEDVPDGRSGTTTTNYVVNSADPATGFTNGDVVTVKRSDDPVTGLSVWVGSKGGGGTPGTLGIAYGTANADWPQFPSTPNQIELTPCVGLHDSTPTGGATVTAYIVCPPPQPPHGAWIEAGDVLAYIPVGTDEGVIINVAQTGGLLKLTGAASGGGFYDARILLPPASAPFGTATLSESSISADPGADNCIAFNLAEMGQDTHQIKFSGTPTPYQYIYPIAALIGYSSGVPVVAFWGGGARGTTDTPTTVGANTEGSDTASTTTFTWDPADPKPVAIWIVSDVVYSDAGDQKLYAMKRKLTFDSNGLLYSVSAETRVLVDTPV